MSDARSRPRRRRGQWGSLAAVLLGVLVVVAVQWLDGGTLPTLWQPSAALVVFGGTCAATLVSYSPSALFAALRAAVATFARPEEDFDELSAHLVSLAVRAHRNGLLALDGEIDSLRDPFLRNGLTLVVDGASSETLHDALRSERLASEAREDVPARIFEAAAGYAPTLGILGAVLGLMRAMDTLGDAAAFGSGIATAFVATVYGVGGANLVLLPVAARLRESALARTRQRDLVTSALLDLQRRLHPRLVAHKARPFTSSTADILPGYPPSPLPEVARGRH